jgi:hypothetical protein
MRPSEAEATFALSVDEPPVIVPIIVAREKV